MLIIADSEYDLEVKNSGQEMPESHDEVIDKPSPSKKGARAVRRGSSK
jgi:hypothetical protein